MPQDLDALNKQAILAARQHMGRVAWPTVLLTVFVVFGVVACLGLFASGELPFLAALGIYSALTYMSYTPLHEAAHDNVQGKNENLAWLNDLCGYLVAPLIMIPYASHKLEHFTHHRYTNQGDKDPDDVVRDMGKSPIDFLLTGFRFLWLQNSFFYKHHWPKASAAERAIYVAELSFSAAWRIAFVVLVARESAAALLGLGYFIGAFFTAYWFAYRPHQPHQNPKRYQNTNSLIMPVWMKPVEWFWLGQNIHSIHHLFPRVPFYRYGALHREIEPVMRAHGTPMIGLFSREPIPPANPASVR